MKLERVMTDIERILVQEHNLPLTFLLTRHKNFLSISEFKDNLVTPLQEFCLNESHSRAGETMVMQKDFLF